MADPSPPPPPPQQQQQPVTTQPSPQKPEISQPDNLQTQTQNPPILNPNPNPNPQIQPPPQINNPFTHAPPPMGGGSTGVAIPPPSAPSFRPAGAPSPIPVPQFTPIVQNPNLPQQQQQQQPMYQAAPPPGVVTSQQGQPMYQQQQMRPPYINMNMNMSMHPPPPPNGYMVNVNVPQGQIPPPGVIRYPYPPMARPPFLPRPGAVGTVPPMPRPPFLGLRPPMTPPIVVRPPILPIVAEKPQTTVYVGKVAPSVENEFIRSLLELCGPIKSWKRAQDPSDGTLKRFGFCEFVSAEGILRALRLLSKCNVDGEELVLNVDQGTRDYLERYIEKKKESLNKPSDNGAEGVKKEGESASEEVDKGEGQENEPAKEAVEEPNKDGNETGNKEKDMSVFGLVTDEDRKADREALEKLTSMIEERVKTRPPPPPPPPALKAVDGVNNSNAESIAKSGDKDSDTDAKNEEKNEDEMTSETKHGSRGGTESPDRSRRYDNRSRDRDRERDKREKERELDRLERERERERARRERERELEIQKAERFYKERVKEWEAREKDKEHKKKSDREKEKDRERERRRLIAEQEDESDDDSRKRRRKSEIDDRRRRRRREKEEDSADRLKEEEEIAEAKKRAEEEEQQRQQEKDVLELPSAPLANGGEKHMPEDISSEMIVDTEHTQESDSMPVSNTGDGVLENGSHDETTIASGPTNDVKTSGSVPTKKLGFGLVGSGKRTTVPSVFHEEEDDDADKDKKMRPLVPIDYSTEELQAVHTNDEAAPPNSAAPAESGKRIPKEVKSEAEKERSRRAHDRSGHRDRDRDVDDTRAREEPVRSSNNRNILDAKQLIDMIPKTKDDLFSYEINWAVYDENRLHERMRPWISKKITEFLGEEETTLVEFIVDKFREHVKAEKMLDVLQQILDEEAEMFVLKMWRMLIFEIKRVETGLAPRPGA